MPVVQVDKRNFLSSKRSIEKIERSKNNLMLEIERKTLQKQKSHTFVDEEIMSGCATVETSKKS